MRVFLKSSRLTMTRIIFDIGKTNVAILYFNGIIGMIMILGRVDKAFLSFITHAVKLHSKL